MYMLDTDMCSYILRERPVAALKRFENTDASLLCISVITQAELLYGVIKSPSKKMDYRIIMRFLSGLNVMNWDGPAAEMHATIRVELERKGRPCGNFDTMIAAHALSVGATVVTNNIRHFSPIPRLKVENWAA